MGVTHTFVSAIADDPAAAAAGQVLPSHWNAGHTVSVSMAEINATGTPSASNFLRGDGSWQSVTTSPAGSDTYVQFNDGGAFGAEAGFAYNKTTNTLSSEKLALGTAGAASGVLTLSGSTSGTVTLQSAAAAGTYSLTLPTSDGNSGEVLTTDGSGVLSWAASAGGSPGGSSGQLQYNNAGAFGGTSGITTTGTELTIASGTKTASTPVLDISQTWNNAAVTFTGLQFNATNTASNAASLLMDLQVSGTSNFSVSRSGAVVATTSYGFPSNTAALKPLSSNRLGLGPGNGYLLLGVSSASLDLGIPLSFCNTANQGGQDLYLYRDAAGTLAQRNGTNAQTLRVYNTYTDASNYERGFARWASNVFEVGAEAAGTGTNRNVKITSNATVTIYAGGNVQFQSAFDTRHLFLNTSGTSWASAGAVANGVFGIANGDRGSGGALQLTEMTAPAAPATNSVRIYAEDNGAGKTRLMALFATGAAQQIAIEP